MTSRFELIPLSQALVRVAHERQRYAVLGVLGFEVEFQQCGAPYIAKLVYNCNNCNN